MPPLDELDDAGVGGTRLDGAIFVDGPGETGGKDTGGPTVDGRP